MRRYLRPSAVPLTGMTATPTATNARPHARKTRPAVPAPRRSPEESPAPTTPEDPYDAYPGVRYALEHATALRPGRS
jgi:hypothetical protein